MLWSLTLILTGCGEAELTFDRQGRPHGTGVRKIFYESGELKQEDYYVDGVPNQQVWYTPEGVVIRREHYKDGAGTGLYLYETGAIRAIIPYVEGVAHGFGVHFSEGGEISELVEYERGSVVTNSLPGLTHTE